MTAQIARARRSFSLGNGMLYQQLPIGLRHSVAWKGRRFVWRQHRVLLGRVRDLRVAVEMLA